MRRATSSAQLLIQSKGWGPLILSRLPACEDPVAGRRRSFTGNLRVVGKLFWCLSANFRAESIRQRMKHGTVHFLRALWHPLDSRWKDYEMRKGFTRKPQGDEPATRPKNYITPSGLQRLKDEHRFLLTRERPATTSVMAGLLVTAIAVKTPTISTASGGCGRSMGGFAFSRSESKPRKWWTRKIRERGKRRRGHSSERPCAMPMAWGRSEW